MSKMIYKSAGEAPAQKDEIREGAIRLFGALSGVDEEYLAACEADRGADGRNAKPMRPGMRSVYRYGMAAAAVVCVALLGVNFRRLSPKYNSFMAEDSAMWEVAPAMDALTDTAQTDMTGGPGGSTGGTGGEAYVSLESAEITKDVDDTPSGGTGGANGAKDTASDSRGGANGGQDAVMDGTGGAGGGEMSSGNAQGSADMSADKSMKTDLPEKEDFSALPRDDRKEMTLIEARDLPVVGAYIPVAWPASGKLESVSGYDTEGREEVYMTWTYEGGRDSFFLSVMNLGKELPEEIGEMIVDIDAAESYDTRLYDISYADTVPEEYRIVFQDPVFWSEELTKECVEARIRSYAGDSGDTDTPRGAFRVLYRTEQDDYVVLRFNGRGSVDEIWYMISTISLWK